MNEKTRVYLEFSDEVVELTNNSYLRLIDINIGMPVAKMSLWNFLARMESVFRTARLTLFLLLSHLIFEVESNRCLT